MTSKGKTTNNPTSLGIDPQDFKVVYERGESRLGESIAVGDVVHLGKSGNDEDLDTPAVVVNIDANSSKLQLQYGPDPDNARRVDSNRVVYVPNPTVITWTLRWGDNQDSFTEDEIEVLCLRFEGHPLGDAAREWIEERERVEEAEDQGDNDLPVVLAPHLEYETIDYRPDGALRMTRIYESSGIGGFPVVLCDHDGLSIEALRVACDERAAQIVRTRAL